MSWKERRQSLGQMTAIPVERTVQLHPRTLAKQGRTRELRPYLSDELMFAKHAHLPSVRSKTAKAISEAHRTSRAFVFDSPASYRVGEICSYAPDLIADQQEFARCPYERTWIELDGGALLRAMEDAGLNTWRADARTGDERVGFLYTERGIYTAASNPEMDAYWSPIAYRPHQPMTRDQEDRFCHDFGCSRAMIDQFMWGTSYQILDPSRRRVLRAENGIDILLEDGTIREHGGLSPMLQGGGAGDLKVALCAALLLIRPNLTVVTEERKPGRKLVLGRPTVFLAHRVVTVRLDPDRLIKRITRACHEERGRARARWHEVRGHYMHNHRAKVSACIHDWREVEPLKWECARGCGGRRAWRTYPEGRGSAEYGVVTKHYEVRP
jgi:hypothetical protein